MMETSLTLAKPQLCLASVEAEHRDTAPILSVVMPCLNEAETLGRCIVKAQQAIRQLGVSGEIVVADNGSTDHSIEIAESLGARVVHVESKGYGCALRAGVSASRGRFVVMGDSDDSYDFSRLSPFLDALTAGADLVMGNRFLGGIMPGAMPWKHRYIGNPVLTAIGRLFFRSPVGDFHCGLRAFTRTAFDRMDLRTPGMEFASEMVIRATLLGLRVDEVPTVLHKDGRSRPPHLRSWRDGWRHLRFMLLLCPLWLFLVPGLALSAAGLATGVWLLPGERTLGSVRVDIHTLLIAACVALLGTQLVAFGLLARRFARLYGLLPESRRTATKSSSELEVGLVVGLTTALGGAASLVAALVRWSHAGFGALDPTSVMRLVIPGVFLAILGTQIVFNAFFMGLLGMPAERRADVRLHAC
jgi:hypothetical protein